MNEKLVVTCESVKAPETEFLRCWLLAGLEHWNKWGVHAWSKLSAAIDSYESWQDAEFSSEHDHFRLMGQDNLRRYLPVQDLG